METLRCRGLGESDPILFSIGGNSAPIYVEAELSLWEFGRGMEGAKGIYPGYHLGHLLVYIFEVSNRVRCKEWEAVEYGKGLGDSTLCPSWQDRENQTIFATLTLSAASASQLFPSFSWISLFRRIQSKNLSNTLSTWGTSLVVQWLKTSPSNTGGAGLIPGQGAKIPHASWPKKPKYKTEAIL